jgi:hypothetical protein
LNFIYLFSTLAIIRAAHCHMPLCIESPQYHGSLLGF